MQLGPWLGPSGQVAPGGRGAQISNGAFRKTTAPAKLARKRNFENELHTRRPRKGHKMNRLRAFRGCARLRSSRDPLRLILAQSAVYQRIRCPYLKKELATPKGPQDLLPCSSSFDPLALPPRLDPGKRSAVEPGPWATSTGSREILAERGALDAGPLMPGRTRKGKERGGSLNETSCPRGSNCRSLTNGGQI